MHASIGVMVVTQSLVWVVPFAIWAKKSDRFLRQVYWQCAPVQGLQKQLQKTEPSLSKTGVNC